MKLFSKKDTCVMDNAEVRKLKRKACQYDEMHEALKTMKDIYLDPKFDEWRIFYREVRGGEVSEILALQAYVKELKAELNLAKDDNTLIETCISLNKENANLSEEIMNMNEKLWKCDKEIERLKKELEYQELLNSKLTYANVKQVETLKQRNAEVGALKHMLDRLEEE